MSFQVTFPSPEREWLLSLPQVGASFPGEDLDEIRLTRKPLVCHSHLLLCFLLLRKVGGGHFPLLPCLTEYHFPITELKLACSSDVFYWAL